MEYRKTGDKYEKYIPETIQEVDKEVVEQELEMVETEITFHEEELVKLKAKQKDLKKILK